MKKNLIWVIIAVLATIIGFVIVTSQISSQLTFGFDQARDAFEANSIWPGLHLKILGPTTDIPGVFHGVLWFYFLAFTHFLGRSILASAQISQIFFFLSVPLVGLAAQKIFRNVKVTFLTISFYVLSPLFLAFTRWLSNPSLSLLIIPSLLFFLWNHLTKPSGKNALLSGILFGLLIQSNLAFGIILFILPIYLWHFHLKPKVSHIIFFALGLIVTTSSYVIADIKFGGQSLTALVGFFLHGGSNPAATQAFFTLVDRIFEFITLTVLPWPKLAAIIFIIFLFFAFRRQKLGTDSQRIIFLFIWLFGFVIFQMISSAISGSAFVLVIFIFPLTVLFAYFLARLPALLIILILISQIATNLKWQKEAYSPLSVQKGMFLSDEEKLIDYTYQKAQGKPFIINSITNPLYINSTWSYLYQFYGQPKYGYLPFWGGRDQTGYLGDLPQKPFGEDLRYLIIESPVGIPDFYVAKIIYEEDKVSDIVEEKSFGSFRVQQREFHPNKGPIPLPANLSNVTPDLLK